MLPVSHLPECSCELRHRYLENQLQTSSVSNWSFEKNLRDECFLVALVRNSALGDYTLLLHHWVVNWITSKGIACSVSVSLRALSILQCFHNGACEPYLKQKCWFCTDSAVCLLSS